MAFRRVLLQILGCKDFTMQHLLQSASTLRKVSLYSEVWKTTLNFSCLTFVLFQSGLQVFSSSCCFAWVEVLIFGTWRSMFNCVLAWKGKVSILFWCNVWTVKFGKTLYIWKLSFSTHTCSHAYKLESLKFLDLWGMLSYFFHYSTAFLWRKHKFHNIFFLAAFRKIDAIIFFLHIDITSAIYCLIFSWN